MHKYARKAALDNRFNQLNPCHSLYFRSRGVDQVSAAFNLVS